MSQTTDIHHPLQSLNVVPLYNQLITNQTLNSIQNNIQYNIEIGAIKINQQHNKNQSNNKIVYLKKQIIEKEIKSLDQELQHNQSILNKAKKQIKHIKSVSQQLNKSQQKQKRINAAKMVEKWNKQRQLLQNKRVAQMQRIQYLTKQQQIKAKIQQEKQQQFAKLQKRKLIQKRLKELQQKKLSRRKIINSASHSKLPKYKVAEQIFQQKQKEKELQLENILKSRKMLKMLNAQEIKKHEKAYIDRIKQRLNIKTKSPQKISEQKVKAKSQFDLYLNRKTEKVKEQAQKVKRRLKFQEKVSKIPLHIDQQKKIQRQIAIDKAKNPFKYNFLSQKSLNPEQIYKQFPDFNMDIDRKKIGIQYLQKLKQQPKLRVSKSNALKRSQLDNQQKIIYKNYLPQVKIHKSKNLDEIELTKKLYKGKSKQAIEILNKKSEDYQNNVLKKIKQLKNVTNYQDSMKKQSQIDQLYMKSIKARIACLEIK